MHATENRHPIRTKEHEYLLPEVESALSRLLEMEIVYHLRLEQLKLDLEEIEDFDLKKLFKMVDAHRKRCIDKNALKAYLKRMGHIVQPKEVVCILRRLDIDGDSRVSFQEFVEAISAVSPEIVPVPARREPPRSPVAEARRVQPVASSSFQGPSRSAAGPPARRESVQSKLPGANFTLVPQSMGEGSNIVPPAGVSSGVKDPVPQQVGLRSEFAQRYAQKQGMLHRSAYSAPSLAPEAVSNSDGTLRPSDMQQDRGWTTLGGPAAVETALHVDGGRPRPQPADPRG